MHEEIQLQQVLTKFTVNEIFQPLRKVHVEVLHFGTFNHQLTKVKLVLLHDFWQILCNPILAHKAINTVENLRVDQVGEKLVNCLALLEAVLLLHLAGEFRLELVGLRWVIVFYELEKVLIVFYVRFQSAHHFHLIDKFLAEFCWFLNCSFSLAQRFAVAFKNTITAEYKRILTDRLKSNRISILAALKLEGHMLSMWGQCPVP